METENVHEEESQYDETLFKTDCGIYVEYGDEYCRHCGKKLMFVEDQEAHIAVTHLFHEG